MKTLKFRVRDLKTGKLLDPTNNEYAITSRGKLIISNSEWYSELKNVNEDDYEIFLNDDVQFLVD